MSIYKRGDVYWYEFRFKASAFWRGILAERVLWPSFPCCGEVGGKRARRKPAAKGR